MARTQLLVLTSVLMMSLITRDTDAQVMMDMAVEAPEIEVHAVDRIDNIMGGGTNVNRTSNRTVIAGPSGVLRVDRNRTRVGDSDRGAGVARDSVVGVSPEGTLRADRDRAVIGDRDRGVGVIGREGSLTTNRDGTVRATERGGTAIGDTDGSVRVTERGGTVIADRDRGVGVVGGDRTVTRDRDTGVRVTERGGAAGIGREGAVVVGRNRTIVADRDRGLGVVTRERGQGVGPDGRLLVERDRAMITDQDRSVRIGGETWRVDRDRMGPRRNFTGADDFILDGVTTITVAQQELNARCARLCKTELCYLSDVDDCRNFITCQQDAVGRYHATLQPCAFGTYWAGLQLQKKITCDVPTNVVCNIDYCAGRPAGSMYGHTDGNCKTYWECDSYGRAQPRCCPEGYRFDNSREQCVEDRLRRCHDRCPIKIDACRIPGTTTEYFDDGNCRTYWDCEDQRPHPVCCPEGQGYDVLEGCVPRRLCNDTCPPQYRSDICLQTGVERYSLIDGSCRTYMKCNPVDGDERWCCPSNYLFDSATQMCIERTADMDLLCDDSCPMFFHEDCHLRTVPDRPDLYYVYIHGTEVERPCAPGTLFDISKCGCATVIRNTPDNSCSKELDIVFDHPMWHRSGSQSQVEIINVGTLEEGPKLNGRTSFRFNGDLYFRTPFFQSQYDNLYIKLVYLPETMAGKQVLLSNCMNLDLGAPSMELSLQNDRLVLDLVTDNIYPNATFTQNRPVSVSVPYTPGIWNTFTAVYNGRQVYLLNEGQGAPTFDNHTLTGPISVAAEGLDFGGCYINRGSGEGFVGSLAQLEFSKCLKQSWLDVFSSDWQREPRSTVNLR